MDIPTAHQILAYNLQRYPNCIFFQYFQARLYSLRAEPVLALESLQAALSVEVEFVQLQHMCLWDYARDCLQMCRWKEALDCAFILREESNWSRVVYTYAAAVSLLQIADDRKENEGGGVDADAAVAEADKLMMSITELKKFAGKSVPVEVHLLHWLLLLVYADGRSSRCERQRSSSRRDVACFFLLLN